jgi:hypothetical protein
MSEANFSKISYVKETVFAETPDQSKTLKRVRFTKSGFKKTNTTVVSDTIRGDRQIEDLIKVGVGATGPLTFELAALDSDPFLVSLLMGSLNTASVAMADVDISVSAQTISNQGGEDLTPLVGARYLKISGCGSAGNNGIKKVVSIDSNTSVITLAAGSLVANETDHACTAACNFVRNGIQPIDSYLFEESFTDPLSFVGYLGMCVNQLDLTLKAQATIEAVLTFLGYNGVTGTSSFGAGRATATLTYGGTQPPNDGSVTINGKVYRFKTVLTEVDGNVFIGADVATTVNNLIAAINLGAGAGTLYATATTANTSVKAVHGAGSSVTLTALQAGSAPNLFPIGINNWTGASSSPFSGGVDPTPFASTTIFNTTANVGTVLENGVASICPVTQITMKIINNLRTRFTVGNEGTLSPGVGDFDVTGQLTVYFKDVAMLNAFFNHAQRSLEIPLVDGAGNRINLFLPAIRYSDGAPTVEGKNTDLMLPLNFQSFADPTLGYTCQIDLLTP